MAITITERSAGKFMVDITFTPPGEHRARRFRKIPEGQFTRRTIGQWADVTLTMLMQGKVAEKEAPRVVPTLAEFWPDFLEKYARANRQKPSEIVSKESRYRIHLGPLLGEKKLDAISDIDVQAVKAKLSNHAPKTVNNVLSVLGKALKVAVKWKVIREMPCEVGLVKVQKKEMQFYERDVLERLIVAAKKVDDRAELVVLLGAEAGLRSGEMIGLEWGDLDFKAGRLTVNRNVYKGKPGAPKGGRSRSVPMTLRLARALAPQRGTWPNRLAAETSPVLWRVDDRKFLRMDPWTMRDWMERAQRLAGISTGEVHKGKHRGNRDRGRLHVLRHTFCSHLVQAGVPVHVIKELAGHANLTTTMGYMHLAKGSAEAAIEALEEGRSGDLWRTVKEGLNPKQKEMLAGTFLPGRKARAR